MQLPTLTQTFFRHQKGIIALALALPFLLAGPPAATAEAPKQQQIRENCQRPAPVCAARDAVFALAGPTGIGSATRLSETELVTTRHLIEGEQAVELFLPDGTRTRAEVIPSTYPADLILLHAQQLPEGPVLVPLHGAPEAPLFTVGADVSFGRIRTYDPGRILLSPATGHAHARLHHTAYGQPAHSGGALVTAEGRLAAIVASGGDGRFEAIPVSALKALRAESGPAFTEESAAIGAAIRICAANLDRHRTSRAPLDKEAAKALITSCTRSRNRQNLDLAAQILGTKGRFEQSIALFEAALAEDPNALNSRVGLAVSYHLAARYEEGIPHLRFLMQHLRDDHQILRLALQAGVWGGDRDLAEAAFERIGKVNPNMLPVARRFLNNPPPRPPQRSSQRQGTSGDR